jgi:hypothetical protein
MPHRLLAVAGLGELLRSPTQDTRMAKTKRRWRPNELEVVPGDSRALRAWAEKAIYWDAGEFDWSYAPSEQRYFIERVAQLATEDISLTPDEWDRLLWNLPLYAGPILNDRGVDLRERVRLLDSLAAVLTKTTPLLEGELASFMFWDVVVHAYQNHSLGHDEALVLRTALFDAMASQLHQSNKALQMSALHGLNHLHDPRTYDLVASLRDSFADDEVRRFSHSAAAFALP